MEKNEFEYCRACLIEDTGNMKDLQDSYDNNLKFADLLSYILGKSNNSIVLPTFLCNECEEHLIQAYFFRKQCLESEKQFLKTNYEYEISNVSEVLDESKISDLSLDEMASQDNEKQPGQMLIVDDNDQEESQDEYLIDFGSSKLHFCRKCDINFTSRKEYNAHYHKRHRGKCACPECGKILSRQVLKRHQAQQHPNIIPVKQEPDSLNENVSESDEKLQEIPIEDVSSSSTVLNSYGCRKCSIKFNTLKEYTIHYEKAHRETGNTDETNHNNDQTQEKLKLIVKPKWYGCRKCNVKYTTHKEYSVHYKEEHTEMHVCQECGKLVKRRNLKHHQETHDQTKRPVCDECGKSFSCLRALKFHVRIHTGDCRYECEYCGKKFIHLSGKESHIQTHHSTEKKFECKLCGKKFAHKTSFNRHMLCHSGNKRHQCTFCPRTFYTLTDLKNHNQVVHIKEKNHICKICSKAFSIKRYLTLHMRTHLK